jgi:hypothetical protein
LVIDHEPTIKGGGGVVSIEPLLQLEKLATVMPKTARVKLFS